MLCLLTLLVNICCRLHDCPETKVRWAKSQSKWDF